MTEPDDTARARALMDESPGLVDELDEQRALANVSAGLVGSAFATARVGRFVKRNDDALEHLENAARLATKHNDRGRLVLNIHNRAIKLLLRRGGTAAIDAAAQHLATAKPLLDDERVPVTYREMLEQRSEDIRLARAAGDQTR